MPTLERTAGRETQDQSEVYHPEEIKASVCPPCVSYDKERTVFQGRRREDDQIESEDQTPYSVYMVVKGPGCPGKSFR